MCKKNATLINSIKKTLSIVADHIDAKSDIV